MDTQKGWEKPKLIVLGRGRPEEHVLAGCKYSGAGGPDFTGCVRSLTNNGACRDHGHS